MTTAANDQPGGPLPDGNASSPDPTAADVQAELARARERLAFYESFDGLIQENIARSGDLMRKVAAEREATERELAAARAEIDRQLEEQRAVLTKIAEDLHTLQTHAGALASRVDSAMDRMGVDAQSLRTVPAPPPPAAPMAPSLPEPAAAIPRATNAEPAIDATPRFVEVVVHGVPRAAAALSLQRHLAGLRHVEAVEAREYVAGVLRLQVRANEPVALDDLRRWDGGAGVQPVHLLADVVEVRLPGATTPEVSRFPTVDTE